MNNNLYIKNALELLKKSPLKATTQRLNLIKLLFRNGPAHFTAEEVYHEVNRKKIKVSLATIYNCLNQFKDNGIIKVVKTSSDKVYFDTNLRDHHHFYCQNSEQLIDIKEDYLTISKLPKLPKGKRFKSVDVVINIVEE